MYERLKKIAGNSVKLVDYLKKESYIKSEKYKFEKNILSSDQLKHKYQYYYVGNQPVDVEYTGRNKTPDNLAKYLGTYKPTNQYLFEINGGFLYPPNGIPVTKGGKIIYQYDIPDLKYYIYRLKTEHSINPSELLPTYSQNNEANTEKQILESVFPLGTGFRGGGYCHWFDETLPQLRLFEKYCTEQDEKPVLIVPHNLTTWMKRSLELLGYTEDDYIVWDDSIIKAEKLLVPTLHMRNSSNYSTFRTNKNGIEWVANKIKSNVHFSDASPYSERIVINREDADQRRVINHQKLMDELSDRGFVSYTLSSMNFEEQVKMFKNAKQVIAPHGAGLVNTIFSDQVNLVELFPGSTKPHYFILSNELNNDYDFVICDQINRKSDMEVPIERLVQLLET